MADNDQEMANAGTEASAAPTETDVERQAAQQETHEETGETASGAGGTETEKEKEESKVVKEVKHLRKRAQDAEADAQYWRGVAEGRGRETATATETEVRDPNAPPVPSDFDTYDDYIVAKVEWTREQREKKTKAAETEGSRRETAVNKIREAAEKDEKLADLIEDRRRWSTLHISPIMLEAIGESEDVAGVLKFLDANRSEAKRIFGLGPVATVREIGKIEAKIVNGNGSGAAKGYATETEKKEEKKVSVSMAPNPPTTVAAKGGNATVDLEQMSMTEFARHRNKQQYGR